MASKGGGDKLGQGRPSRDASAAGRDKSRRGPGEREPSSTRRAPTDDLLGRRDEFIQTFFRKGAELTEELLREDEKLRERLRVIEEENAALRAQVASDDAIRDLLSKIERLEKDKRDLLSRIRDAQASSTQYSARFAEIEAENAKLASLYVASFQLHSTLDVPRVVGQIKELLVQFVGARALALYLADESDPPHLVVAASEGVPTRDLGPVAVGEGAIGRTFATGRAHWVERDATKGTVADPAACIPLRIGDRAAGVIAVFSTFEQKPSFVELDFELFHLLAAHAASALAAARLFAQAGGRLLPLDAFVDVA